MEDAPPVNDAPRAPLPRATLVAVAVLTGMNLLNYIDRFVMPAVIETVRRDIPMTDAQQGTALTAFVWVYMLVAPVFGRAGDRVSRTRLVALGVALWSVATAAAAYAHTLRGLIAARALVGVGEAAYATISPTLIGDYFPRAQRNRAMSVFYLATPVGSALGYVLGGSITAHYSWRTAFLAVGVPGLALAASALWLRDPPRGQHDEPDEATAAPGYRDALRGLARNRGYTLNVAASTAYTFALGGLAQWMPAYLMRVRHMDGAHANNVFGALTVLSGLLGTAAGGALAEALRGRVRHPYFVVCAGATAVGVPLSLLAFQLPSPGALWAATFLAELFVFMPTGPANTLVVDWTAPAVRATAFALSILAMHALGDAISPVIIGVVSDRSSLQLGVMLVPLAFAVASALWAYAARSLPDARG